MNPTPNQTPAGELLPTQQRMHKGRKPPCNEVTPMQFFNGTPCIPWPGHLIRGYGYVSVAGKNMRAHRAVLMSHGTDIPEGMVIDHLCRNRRCVNPQHLEVVTQRTNILRGVGPSAIYWRRSECPKGHPLSGANLSLVPRSIRPNPYRVCKICRTEVDRLSWLKKKAILAAKRAQAAQLPAPPSPVGGV